MKSKNLSKTGGDLPRFPLLPLRDIVIFPHMVVPLFVGREKSISALEAAMSGNKSIFLATQKNAATEDPNAEDVYTAGVICQIIQLLKLPDGTVKVLIEGKKRGIVVSHLQHDDYFLVEVQVLAEVNDVDPRMEALMRGVCSTFEDYVKLTKNVTPDVVSTIAGIADPAFLADNIVSHLNLKIADKQDLLATNSPADRLEKLLTLMVSEIEILQIEKKIHSRVKKQMEKSQREYYLNEQMRAIQKELGGKDDFKEEIRDLEAKIGKAFLSEEAKVKATAELKKLKMMSPMSAEAAVVRNYIEWLISLPWEKTTDDEKVDIEEASKILNADHFGIEKVKQRILEYLAVNKLVKTLKGPIICLVGPPGVGKTSLARSIARATGRSFVKMSLGGVRDEAEIRGHRRTYIGAMPGKIMQSLKKVGVSNPVFLLDEIDKMNSDFRGDPASALLEVLDPEQNAIFNDHFLDVDYDLSNVMFITTANSLHTIPRPLLDRLEVIRLEGYLELEKMSIAKDYLIRKQLSAHGLNDAVSITDKAVIEIIRYYTREAGVRGLERELAAICRKVAHCKVKGGRRKFVIQPKQVREYLGVQRYKVGTAEEKDAIGVVTGLAWTEVGGELLNVEVAVLPGKGKLTITGKLGEVMQESAQTAMTYVRSRAMLLGLEKDFYQDVDIHIHVPEGAIPKDGPSAGITMATALTSALTGCPVRRDVAMTGEVTLRGRVLPIGGLKEKLLAARRGMIKTVLIPSDNEKDLVEVPVDLTSGITIKCVAHMDEVISIALQRQPETCYGIGTVPLEVAAKPSEEAVTAH